MNEFYLLWTEASPRNPTAPLTSHLRLWCHRVAERFTPSKPQPRKANPQRRALSGLTCSSRALRPNLPSSSPLDPDLPASRAISSSSAARAPLAVLPELSSSSLSSLFELIWPFLSSPKRNRFDHDQRAHRVAASFPYRGATVNHPSLPPGFFSAVAANPCPWLAVDAPDNWVDGPYCWFDHCRLLWLLAAWVIISRCYCWLSLNRVKLMYKKTYLYHFQCSIYISYSVENRKRRGKNGKMGKLLQYAKNNLVQSITLCSLSITVTTIDNDLVCIQHVLFYFRFIIWGQWWSGHMTLFFSIIN